MAHCLLAVAVILCCQTVYAADPPPDLLSAPSVEALSVKWTPAPAEVHLGTVASFHVPPGFRFTDADGARTALGQAKIAVPQDLIGLLQPTSGEGYVLIEFAPIGYVKDTDKSLDAEAILKTAWNRIQSQNQALEQQGLPSVETVEWETKPVYNAAEHSLEWGLYKQIQGQKVPAHTIRLLACHGVLDVTALGTAKDGGVLRAVKTISQTVLFVDGQGYASYRNSDKVAGSGLGEIVLDEASISGSSRNLYAWGLAVGLVVCASGIAGIIVLKKSNRRQSSRSRASAAPMAISKPVATDSESTPAVATPKAQAAAAPAAKNGHSTKANHRNHHGHGGHRRKVFDYNRYFTDLMSTVSNHGNMMETSVVSPEDENGRLPHAAEPARSEQLQPLVVLNNNSDVIEQQKVLIEEQKRLIQEQTRLIEEKTRLITEKNQLLKIQTNLIETKLV